MKYVKNVKYINWSTRWFPSHYADLINFTAHQFQVSGAPVLKKSSSFFVGNEAEEPQSFFSQIFEIVGSVGRDEDAVAWAYLISRFFVRARNYCRKYTTLSLTLTD